MRKLRLMVAMAHPDDETLGVGGSLAKYASEGVETYLVTATRGEKGWWGAEADYPGPTELGRIREAELLAATEVLGVQETELLDYVDGELDEADPEEVTRRIAAAVRRFRPDVLVTFGHDGIFGHPDHFAMCQYVTAAVVRAAGADLSLPGSPHQVAKLYYYGCTPAALAAYQAAFGDLVMHVDGAERRSPGWQDWVITTEIDTSEYWQQVWRAVSCHRTQLPGYEKLAELAPEHHRALWSSQTFYRVFSTVNGGRGREHDLFAGLRTD
jgi:LmbE family N-acetylglucosaminyl deacetylase